MERIAVLGGGNGGQTLAGHLALKGLDVVLFEHPEIGQKKVEAINSQGGIELTNTFAGLGKLRATTDIKEAISGRDILFVVAPSFAQIPLLEPGMPYLEDGQIIVLIPGNFGSFELKKMLREKNIQTNIIFAETDTLPYATRIIEDGKVNVWGVKTGISIAALPSKDTPTVIERLKDFFPTRLNPASNALEIGFSNVNMIYHCPTLLLNTGRIESGNTEFRFYTDGTTPSICKVIETMDRERLEIAKALKINISSGLQWIKNAYDPEGDTLLECFHNCIPYSSHGNDAPKSIRHRYLSEDIPNLLTPVSCLAKKLDIATPVIDSVITLGGILNDVDFMSTGRTLERLGISEMNREDLLIYVTVGM